jgi:CHASE3 domain sensor protein
MTTSQKLWLGFGTLTALLVLSGVAILFRVWSLEGQVDRMANVARPRAAAARELEVSVFAYALAVRSFIQADDPNFSQKAAEAAAVAERHLGDYQRLATTERQRELSARFATLWRGL